MSTLDFLYLILGIGFLLLVGFVSYAAFSLGKTLKVARLILEDLRDFTADARETKDLFKSGLIRILEIFLKRR